jgi:ABC-type Fe3+-siderophore transport system permease subunit
MKKSDITYIVAIVFTSLFSFFYCCTWWIPKYLKFIPFKLPRYYPLEHVWRWGKVPGTPSQGWYGMQAFAFVGAGIIALIVYLILRSRADAEKSLSAGKVKLFAFFGTVVIIFCMGYMLYHEFDKWGVFGEINAACSCLPGIK